MKTGLKLFFGALVLGQSVTTTAVSFDVRVFDLWNNFSTYTPGIVSNTSAAGASWGEHLQSNAELNVLVTFSNNIETATGNSFTSAYVGNSNGLEIYEQGAAMEVRTGKDPNGNWPDILISLGLEYLRNDLWFDPDPYQRSTDVPEGKVDAVSVFLHEIGHALGFNGWRDGIDGGLQGNYASTFDQLVEADGGNLYFIGAGAMQEYGDKVPLTFNNYGHLANPSDARLVSDLMNGVALNRGERSSISSLDVAILADTGVIGAPVDGLFASLIESPLSAAAPSAVPIPAAVWLFGSGLLGLMGLARKTGQSAKAS